MDERALRLLSVVVPLRDEEGTLHALHERVGAALAGVPFELILVDDASSDGTAGLLDSLADEDPRVRVLHLSLRERNRFLRGMSAWVGYTQTAVPYERDARHAGETKFTLRKMLRFSLDAITAFSWRPLQLATVLGFLLSLVALLTIPVVLA